MNMRRERMSRATVTRDGAVPLTQTPSDAVRAEIADERGDVPGWVLITLMTAALVIAIWALAAPALSQIFEQAIDRVSGI